ncbi:SDR family oxidoreductase [Amycolatopsis rhabdoformis]|uniref:SDR family oxidoreductase n=1 Tax=Amycolatopsis rhabdoformis TaxID=1448059 RepID=A0ABZ1IM05_9PSEU|nr:SDR family oxidoreductase [Amycolatopsis rhabdoformis]WSE34757.1 SDR family oxidoreductase [Amycolatopsis rhabdoformis]
MQLTGLENKVAIVTGAGRMRSIGREIAVGLARAGCDVVVTGTGRPRDRRPADEVAAGWRDIDSVADEIRALGRRALPVVSDVTDEAAVAALARTVVAEFGRVDILVNNAGAPIGTDRRPVVGLDLASWNRVLQTNLTGTFLVSREIGRLMVERGEGGCIVNMSSVAGKLLPPNSAAYAASKAGVQALTACMAQEVGGANVRVNALCPGYVETVRLDGVADDAWAAMLASIPLGRAGSPADIASAVLFLCSDQGAWVTGQAWNVDGGHVVGH